MKSMQLDFRVFKSPAVLEKPTHFARGRHILLGGEIFRKSMMLSELFFKVWDRRNFFGLDDEKNR